jgi:CheY-like chemotaxis protein
MGQHILVIDDDPEEHFFLRETINDLVGDCELISYESARDAIEYLAECSAYKRPDIILLDINMPRMNGFVALQLLKADEYTCKIPVWMYSTSNTWEDRHKAGELGADGYYCKPASLEGYRNVVLNIFANIQRVASHH